MIHRMKISSLIIIAMLGLALNASAAWTQVALNGETNRPQDVTYYNDLYIAAGYDGEIFTSPDGAVWTAQSLPVNEVDGFVPGFRGIVASDDFVVAVGDNGLIARSANGVDWTIIQQPELSLPGYQSIAYNGTVFVAVTYGNEAFRSNTGASWTAETVTEDAVFLAGIAYTGSAFIAIPQSGSTAYSSADGSEWSSFGSSLWAFSYITNARFAGGMVYATGGIIQGTDTSPALASSDGASVFSYINLSEGELSGPLMDIAEGPGGEVVAAGGIYQESTTLFTSTDGVGFAQVNTDLTSSPNAIVYANGLWVIVGEGYAAYTDSLSGGGGSTPYLVDGAIDLGNGWYDTWLGDLNINSWPWVYAGVGWFYAGNAGNSNASSWFFFTNAQLNCWVWASENSAQWVYCQPTGQPLGWWFVDSDSVEGFTYLFGPGGAVIGIEDEF